MRADLHKCEVMIPFYWSILTSPSDMRKGTDARTLSVEVLMDCGNIIDDFLVFILICSGKWKFLWHYCLFDESMPLNPQINGYLVTI